MQHFLGGRSQKDSSPFDTFSNSGSCNKKAELLTAEHAHLPCYDDKLNLVESHVLLDSESSWIILALHVKMKSTHLDPLGYYTGGY